MQCLEFWQVSKFRRLRGTQTISKALPKGVRMKWLDDLLGRRKQAAITKPTLTTVNAPKGHRVNPKGAKDQAHNADIQRKRATSLGLVEYKWLAARPDACRTAAKNNGKIFRYDCPPSEGHQGECSCDFDYCRYCLATAVVRGF